MGESVSSNRALIRRMRGRSAFLFNCPFGIYSNRRIKAEVDEVAIPVGEREGRDFFCRWQCPLLRPFCGGFAMRPHADCVAFVAFRTALRGAQKKFRRKFGGGRSLLIFSPSPANFYGRVFFRRVY